MSITLGQIFSATETWQHLSNLKKKPKVSYSLLKFHRQLLEEMKIIEEQRLTYVKEYGKETENGGYFVDPNDVSNYQKFQDAMREYLEAESDIEPLNMTMDELVDAIDPYEENYISEIQLAQLEPFFFNSTYKRE